VTAAVVVLVILALVVLHLIGGLFHHVSHRRRGRRVNVGWSLRRGWWGGVRFLGGTYYHDL
jgi:uncharacterized protein HemY